MYSKSKISLICVHWYNSYKETNSVLNTYTRWVPNFGLLVHTHFFVFRLACIYLELWDSWISKYTHLVEVNELHVKIFWGILFLGCFLVFQIFHSVLFSEIILEFGVLWYFSVLFENRKSVGPVNRGIPTRNILKLTNFAPYLFTLINYDGCHILVTPKKKRGRYITFEKFQA